MQLTRDSGSASTKSPRQSRQSSAAKRAEKLPLLPPLPNLHHQQVEVVMRQLIVVAMKPGGPKGSRHNERECYTLNMHKSWKIPLPVIERALKKIGEGAIGGAKDIMIQVLLPAS